MPTVVVRLTCVLPRWALSSDPHVWVNGKGAVRLTKQPVPFEIPVGTFEVAVSTMAPGARLSSARARRVEGEASEAEVVRFRYRPARTSSWLYRGRLRREEVSG